MSVAKPPRPAICGFWLLLASLLTLSPLLAEQGPSSPQSKNQPPRQLLQSINALERDLTTLRGGAAVKEQLQLEELKHLATTPPASANAADAEKAREIQSKFEAFSKDPKNPTMARRAAFQTLHQNLRQYVAALPAAKTQVTRPGSQAKGRVSAGIKSDPHIKVAQKRQVVDYSFFRMNHPEVITGMVSDVQRGKLQRSALKNVAPPKVVDALMATKWVGFVPEKLAAQYLQPAKPRPSAKPLSPKDKPIALYTADQMKLARWDTIVQNAGQVVAQPVNLFRVSYTPGNIDLGTFPSYQTRRAVLSLTAMNASDVKAQWKKPPQQKIGMLPGLGDLRAFLASTDLLLARTDDLPAQGLMIEKMISYTGEFVNGQPKVDKMVTGAGTLPVKAGQDFVVQIAFKTNLPMGSTNGVLQVNGNAWAIEVPVKAGVLDIKEYEVKADPDEPLVNMVTPWVLDPSGQSAGSIVPVGMTLRNTGDKPVVVQFEGESLPTGIALTPQGVSLDKGQTRHVTVEFKASVGTPTGQGLPGSVRVKYAGDKHVSFPLQFTIRESSVYWTAAWEIRDKVTWDTAVAANSGGWWHWTALLHDSSTWRGDAFVCGFYFNRTLDGQLLGRMEEGQLGAKYSGPATNYWIDYSSVDSRVQSHWRDVYDGGVTFYANAYDDWSAITDWLIATGISVAVAALL